MMSTSLLSVENAQKQILQDISPLAAEQCTLLSSLHRVLAEDVSARYALPPFDNSAMDGYALRARDGMSLRNIVGTSACGDSPDKLVLSSGEAARVMTGAPVPRGADTVVMQEYCTRQEDTLRLQREPILGQHIRRVGSDVETGALLLKKHTVLGAAELAALASQGRSSVSVFRQPVVAILSTGSELVEIDVVPTAGQIVNSNSYALAALVQEAGARPVLLGIVPDNAEATRQALQQALFADVILTSGGVSVGDFDYVKEVLQQLGYQERFWKVDMKPGKPLVYGVLQGKHVLGLPGNPASCQVSFALFVAPLLRALQGHPTPLPPRVSATVLAPIQGGDRRHFVRASVSFSETVSVLPLQRQGSGELRSLLGAACLIDVPARASLQSNETVSVVLLPWQ